MSSISALNKTLNEEKMRFHDELNPAIWEGNKLKDKVAMKLMEIASNFVAYLDVEGFSIEDIIITGSMANYNYTEQSDIDLHIICDYSKLPTNCPILSQEYFQAKKKIYNDKHNIKIYGYDVELYVEDSTAPSLAGGKYSLLKRKWLRFPQKIDFEVDDVIGTEELQDLITQIENVCMTDGNIEEANDLLNRIYEMRKSGLAKGGEFAFENLLFKALRNRGYLDKLRSYIAYAEDLSLSLNESVEYIEGIEILINPSKQELNGFMKKNKVYRVLLTDNDMAIWTADCSICHLDVEGEYPEFNNSEHLFALNGNLFFDDYDIQPDEIEDFYFEDAEKLDNLPIVKKYFPHSQMKKALEMMKKGISVFNTPSKWNDWLGESRSFLTEGIAEIAKKQFPKMPEDKLRKFVALDPTYKGGDQLGKYGQWIIRLFYNNIKNAERMADYKEFYEKNNGINPKTGQVIQKPDLLPQTPYEDADKIPNLLKQYDVLKKEIGQPIDSFKTIPDLYAAIQQHTQKGVPQDKTALERYNVFKACEPKGLKKIYEDNQWIIGIPTTFESSKPFGEFTNWCTTSSNGYYYDRYLNQYGGEYYILLDKTDGALYQFHFESNQFMDETDHQIDMYGFTKDYNNIAKFLYNYKMENNSPEMAKNKLAEKFAEIIKDPQKIQKEILYENYIKDIGFDGNNITGYFCLKYLSKYVYDNNTRDGLNLETVCGLLTDFYDNFSFGDYSLYDYSYQSSDWDKIAKKYGIEKYNWNKICNIYQGNERPEEDDETVNTDIESLIQDDFADDIGLLGFLQTCSEYGTQNECEKDILSSLSDNLPIYNNQIDYEPAAKFSISKEDLWKIYYIMNKRSDDIPEYGKEIKIEKSEKPEMKADWFEFWSSKDDDYYGEDEEAFDDWLYCWRVATGKCDVEDFDNGSFVIDEPYYGWSGFDDKYFEEGCESAAKRIAEILGKTEKKVANESVEDNSYDDYDQILADLENAELTLRNGNQRQKYVNVINKYLAKVGSNIAELSWTGDFIDKVGTKEAQKAVNELYESFSKAGEQPKNLNESSQPLYMDFDIDEYFGEFDTQYVLNAFKENKNLWSPLINPSEYKQALLEFIKYGEFNKFPVKKLTQWMKIIVKGVALLNIMTDLSGHGNAPNFPTKEVARFFFKSGKEYMEYKQSLIENEVELSPEFGDEYATEDASDESILSRYLYDIGFYDWARLPNGDISWSDYGIKPMLNVLIEYDDIMTPEEVIVIINRVLDVVHQNGDLAWAFIEGGRDSLTKISNENKMIKGNQLNESIMFNEEIVYASKKDLSDIILKNPTRKEILEYDNPLLKHQDWRIAKDNNGNYYFGSGYDWIHFEMCDALKKQGIDIDVVFADYDGIASYDSKTNTFYIRDECGEPELIEQEFNNSYLKKAFPNAKLEIDAEYDEMLESKQLNESIMFNDEVYDDFQEEYRQLTVWVNPSIDWIRNKLNESGGFRFLHSIDKNKLYVFTVKSGFMHQQVFDMLDFDWSKNGRNVVGVFNPDNSISIWEALADDGEASSSLKLAEELDNDLFKQIYPNGYELTICY